jgi:TIR domain
MGNAAAPKVFISYSWDDENHKNWVAQFASRLRTDGVDARIDQWELVPGDKLPQFMEMAIRENDFVLLICTPNYKAKADGRKGGVGYEGDIMTAEVFGKGNHRKYIPILRHGPRDQAVPSWLGGKYDINLSGDPFSDEQYHDLLTTLFNVRAKAPPLGTPPTAIQARMTGLPAPRVALQPATPTPASVFEPIKIVGVLADEVGEPSNDGNRGFALYSVPFKLSRRPLADWATHFVNKWNHSPQFTTRHRPGIAEVHGDRIVLTRTTLEEVKDVHRDTLKLVVEVVNQDYAAALKRKQEAERAEAERAGRHKDNVRRLADDIKFD